MSSVSRNLQSGTTMESFSAMDESTRDGLTMYGMAEHDDVTVQIGDDGGVFQTVLDESTQDAIATEHTQRFIGGAFETLDEENVDDSHVNQFQNNRVEVGEGDLLDRMAMMDQSNMVS
jgi:hypothetical protein